ncbi:MAG: type I pullulanase [Firmicutes bacterium]|nr:type I pullulanase [Bacillota bacterium]
MRRVPRFSAWLALLLAVVFAVVMTFQGTVPAAASSQAETKVIIHYHRFDNDYANWNLWLWPYAPTNGNGNAYNFTGTDSFGAVATAEVPGNDTQVGVIVRLGNWLQKDVNQNLYINVTNGEAQVWLVSGIPTVFYSQAAAQQAIVPSIDSAFLDGAHTVLASLNQAVTMGKGTSFSVTDETTGQMIPVSEVTTAQTVQAVVAGDFQTQLGDSGNWDPTSSQTAMSEVNPNLYAFTATLSAGTYHYKVVVGGSWSTAYPGQNVTLTVPAGGGKVTIWYVPLDNAVYDSINNPGQTLPTSDVGMQTTLVRVKLMTAPSVADALELNATGFKSAAIVPRDVLSLPQYTYTGHDLGNTWTQKATSFRVWAPTASAMVLQLFNSANGAMTQQVPMQPGVNGTWDVTVPGNLNGWYYLYQVTIDGQSATAVDPYATAIAPNATRGEIVDLAATNPPGWQGDHYRGVSNPVDAVVYEVSVRDFSIDPNGGFRHPGQYLAFTERGTHGPDGVSTGVDSLKQLGVNYVQIMPIQEFPDPGYSYNWGYDTQNFDVPEGMYATTPTGTARITQAKQMILALHRAGIGVIMDVVYNHTFAIDGDALNTLVPGYFWRTDDEGNYYNGSGVGNEVASERPMVEKFILHSLKYWVTQYHVNGFRFDLMALLGVNTMTKVSQELHAIDPNIILYGEPWTGGTSGLPADQLLVKGKQKGLGIGVFNDNLRNAIEANVFQPTAPGFAMGAPGFVPAIENGVVGSVYYNSSIQDFAAAPSETVNYVTSHDNYTLWDKLKLSNPQTSKADRILMDELAQSVVMTSQGLAFMQGGEEMLRTKGGNGNSYNAGDAVNEFNWARKAEYPSVFNYYAGLIHLRLDHPAFRMTTAAQIRQNLEFLTSPSNTVEFELTNHANGDRWDNIVVIYNPNGAQSFTLPSGKWTIVGTQGVMGERALGKASGAVNVPGITCEVLYQQ